MRVCSVPGCPAIYEEGLGSRCLKHKRVADVARGTASERGYTSRGHKLFRAQVLRRDMICVACQQAISTVADHYPRDRAELVELGLNPNNPVFGRGLCKKCHDISTASRTPAGWNA